MTESTDFSARLESALAGTHALIDLDAYAGNVRAMRALIGADVELMAVVKANAYGHGLVPCARTALDAGADWLAVARIEEGLLLRQHGIEGRILVIGPPNRGLIPAAIAADLAIATGTTGSLHDISQSAHALGKPARVHLKLETGLHRYGVDRERALSLVQAIVADPLVTLEGVYTHCASADEIGDDFVQTQAERFESTLVELRAAGIAVPYAHFANSAAALRGIIPRIPGAQPAVRTGYALYGLSPSSEVPVPDGFRPVLTLKSRIARTFTLATGEGISYGRTYRAERPTRCATLPIGYGDGISRQLSNKGWVLVNGARCPIAGRVAMDLTVIEIEQAPNAVEGDEAILISDGHDGAMTVDEMAALCGTIGYETVTALSARLPRVFRRVGRPIAVSDLRGLLEDRA
jgi:alanine racemase